MAKGSRIGYGYDVHPLGPGRKLILGWKFPITRACSGIPIRMCWSMPSAMPCWARWEKEIWVATTLVQTPNTRGSRV